MLFYLIAFLVALALSTLLFVGMPETNRTPTPQHLLLPSPKPARKKERERTPSFDVNVEAELLSFTNKVFQKPDCFLCDFISQNGEKHYRFTSNHIRCEFSMTIENELNGTIEMVHFGQRKRLASFTTSKEMTFQIETLINFDFEPLIYLIKHNYTLSSEQKKKKIKETINQIQNQLHWILMNNTEDVATYTCPNNHFTSTLTHDKRMAKWTWTFHCHFPSTDIHYRYDAVGNLDAQIGFLNPSIEEAVDSANARIQSFIKKEIKMALSPSYHDYLHRTYLEKRSIYHPCDIENESEELGNKQLETIERLKHQIQAKAENHLTIEMKHTFDILTKKDLPNLKKSYLTLETHEKEKAASVYLNGLSNVTKGLEEILENIEQKRFDNVSKYASRIEERMN